MRNRNQPTLLVMFSRASADLISSQLANAEDFTTAEQVYVATIDISQNNWQEKLNNII